jgi:glycosyltransferase involved in cell wall biosynthesis
MQFSVIVPTFDRVSLLRRALDSVFAQRFAEFETIVVDDGSTDGTSAYLQTLGNRVRPFRQENRGPGAARNLGAKHAQGQYLAFLDSDDRWFPWTLEVYREAIEKHGYPSFVVGKPHIFCERDDLAKVQCTSTRTEMYPDYLSSGDQWRWWGVSSFVIRRDAFERRGGFAEDRVNGEDADLALRLGVEPGFVQIFAPETFAYLEHSGNVTKDLMRTVAGAWIKIDGERAGTYPGGASRSGERRRILTRHTRPIVLDCLRQGLHREAWSLYCATFAWNAALGRVRFLAAFPALAAMAGLRMRIAPNAVAVTSGGKWPAQ